MKDSMKKDARVCLIPDYMETHTITTYRLAVTNFSAHIFLKVRMDLPHP